MHKTVATTAEFLHTWDSRINFLMADECVPFSFEFPPTKQIVERLVEISQIQTVERMQVVEKSAKSQKLQLKSVLLRFRKLKSVKM